MTLKLKKYLSPADCVMLAFGGASRAANTLGLTRQAIYQWKRTKNGIPRQTICKILAIAEIEGFSITLDELMNGKMVNR